MDLRSVLLARLIEERTANQDRNKSKERTLYKGLYSDSGNVLNRSFLGFPFDWPIYQGEGFFIGRFDATFVGTPQMKVDKDVATARAFFQRTAAAVGDKFLSALAGQGELAVIGNALGAELPVSWSDLAFTLSLMYAQGTYPHH